MQGRAKIAPDQYRRRSSDYDRFLTEMSDEDIDDVVGDQEVGGDQYIGGAQHGNPVTVSSSPYNATKNSSIIGVDTTGGAITVNLPDDSGDGQKITVQDVGGNASVNAITIAASNPPTINGAASVQITTNYGRLDIYFDGTNFFAG